MPDGWGTIGLMAMALLWEADLAKGILSEEAPAGARPCAPGAPGALIGGRLALREHLQRIHAHLGVVYLQRTMGVITPESSQLVWADVMCNSVHPPALSKPMHKMCESAVFNLHSQTWTGRKLCSREG